MNDPDRTTTPLSVDEAGTILRAVPYGGVDDSARALRVPPAVQATVSPVIVAIRWAAVMYGLVYAAFKVAGERDMGVVYALVVVLFLTSWRTVRPIRLAGGRRIDVALAFTDTILVGAAVGISGGFDSPYIFSVLACAAVAAFGWGILTGCLNLAVGVVALYALLPFSVDGLTTPGNQVFAMSLLLLLAVVLAGLLQSRLLEAERKRENLSGRLDLLTEANDLLHLLNKVARTLPESLDMREAMHKTRFEIQRAFEADAIAVVVYDDLKDEWAPQITEGCALRPSSTADELPIGLRQAIEAKRPVLIPDFDAMGPRTAAAPAPRPEVEPYPETVERVVAELDELRAVVASVEGELSEVAPATDEDEDEDEFDEADLDDVDDVDVDLDDELDDDLDVAPDESTVEDVPAVAAPGPRRPGLHPPSHVGVGTRTRCGLYSAVRNRGELIGAIAIEHRTARHYTDRHSRIIGGLGDVLALTVDNARSFGRLKTLAAEEERSRIARDLHDRLGQWLSYISFELERIITSSTEDSEELDRLYTDVQTAIDELRETLQQLRSVVTAERPLAKVAEDLIARFNRRGETVAHLRVTSPGQRLPVRVENELLRVLQEGLSNVAKHAQADTVEVIWTVEDGEGTLTIRDDGRGFDAATGVRDSAYGLVGMRERADMIGARVDIESAPGLGTTVTVLAGRDSHGRPGDRWTGDDGEGFDDGDDGYDGFDGEGSDDGLDDGFDGDLGDAPGRQGGERRRGDDRSIVSEDGVTAG